MKRNLLKSIIILLTLTFVTLQSCKKKEFVNFENISTKGTKEVYTEKSIPIFKNQEVYYKIINELATKTEEERKTWEESIGFKSAHTIYNEINEAEIALEEKLYSGYDENLSKEELRKLGLPVDVHSDIYNKYLNKGLIREVKENDNSEAFYLNVIDPVAACFTDENGLMVINDTLWQYTDSKIKIVPGGVSKKKILLNTKSTNKESKVFVIDFNDKSTVSGYNWSKSSGWKYESSKKRYRMDIKGWSYTYGPNDYDYMGSRYWPELRAERKRWGKWKLRNSYRPITRLTGNWSYRYTISKYWYGGPRHTYYNNLSGGEKSPVNISYGHMNNGYLKYANPTGQWSSSWYFTRPVDVYSYSFTGYFDPGNITLSR